MLCHSLVIRKVVLAIEIRIYTQILRLIFRQLIPIPCLDRLCLWRGAHNANSNSPLHKYYRRCWKGDSVREGGRRLILIHLSKPYLSSKILLSKVYCAEIVLLFTEVICPEFQCTGYSQIKFTRVLELSRTRRMILEQLVFLRTLVREHRQQIYFVRLLNLCIALTFDDN